MKSFWDIEIHVSVVMLTTATDRTRPMFCLKFITKFPSFLSRTLRPKKREKKITNIYLKIIFSPNSENILYSASDELIAIKI